MEKKQKMRKKQTNKRDNKTRKGEKNQVRKKQ